jgi:transcriptional regulator with XRE-family HTH domain
MHARRIDVPATVRAARRMRRLSQRELAEYAGVPRSTVDRIESGTSDPRVGTLANLLAAIGVELHACIGGQPLHLDQKREELVDVRGRHLPPHWEIKPVTWLDGWWGWWRKNPNVREFPLAHTYWKPWGRSGEADYWGLVYRWQDAT